MNLSPLDRLYSAPTSSGFAQAVSQFRVLHDVQLVITDPALDGAVNALIGSQRRYRNLKLARGERLVVLRFFEAKVYLITAVHSFKATAALAGADEIIHRIRTQF